MNMKEFGRQIAKERKNKNLTIVEMAKKINKSTSLVSQIEGGKIYPSHITLKLIMDLLEIEQPIQDYWLSVIRVIPEDIIEILFDKKQYVWTYETLRHDEMMNSEVD